MQPIAYVTDAPDVFCPECARLRYGGQIHPLDADEHGDSVISAIFANDEADYIHYCDSCGIDIENALTADGVRYVYECMHRRALEFDVNASDLPLTFSLVAANLATGPHAWSARREADHWQFCLDRLLDYGLRIDGETE